MCSVGENLFHFLPLSSQQDSYRHIQQHVQLNKHLHFSLGLDGGYEHNCFVMIPIFYSSTRERKKLGSVRKDRC